MASRGEKEHKKITSTAHLLFIAYETVLCSAATLTPPENGEIKCGKGHPSVMDFQEELKKWTVEKVKEKDFSVNHSDSIRVQDRKSVV